MNTGMYILNDAGEPVAVSPAEWSLWFDDAKNRQLARDDFGEISVSTVFLGIDHGWGRGEKPILWETMVFGGPLDHERERYTSRDDALAGHAVITALVKALAETGGGS